jgi:hypothetical protein
MPSFTYAQLTECTVASVSDMTPPPSPSKFSGSYGGSPLATLM